MDFIVSWQKYSSVLWSLWNEHIPHQVLNKIKDKLITYNIFRIKSNDSVMCGFYGITFIEYMIIGKTLLDYTHLFSPNDYKRTAK